MMATVEVIEVVCARCGEVYSEWYRPLLESAAPVECPHCGLDQTTDPALRENGVWAMVAEDEAREG